MAVGDSQFPVMHPVSGVQLGTACAGIKQNERDDLLVMKLSDKAVCAALFTQNAFCAAPVLIARKHLTTQPRWLLVNSGNANAGTGKQGVKDALQACHFLAEKEGASTEKVLPFSTGVIGENLPVAKIEKAIPAALVSLSAENWEAAANAIMTTDSRPKGASQQFELQGQKITITGISKGSGMIHPNMATMLAFIATDALIDQALLQQCLKKAVDLSFNCISVDGDTSTNDACVLAATGCVDQLEIKPETRELELFSDALTMICKRLAEEIIRDGEGATKLIRVFVENAASEAEAKQVAMVVAQSPLVKTAFFAADPNWGRILAAVGRAGVEQLNIDALTIWLNDVCIVRDGGRAADYSEAAGQAVMSQDEITIRIDLARGNCNQEVLSCDLSYDYVRINAEYRT
ncbi:MAG: bifunctional ornithine acetyltransferase/N-acetylglutamate synthase [Gammaproteobacteria bacterium]|nr:MAG: bifunctional ornithine acetyltransferase/N-acetylglutamate synthase [Gammaproteobacteria bacterium]